MDSLSQVEVAAVRRTVFNEDHEAFRETLRAFIEAEVVPVYDEWFAAGQAPRDFYYKLAELGVFGIRVDEEFGGAGIDSYQFEAVMYEETARAGVQVGGSGVHVLLGLPYIKMLATDEQKKRFLPKFVSGEEMWALAMTEPGTGSDLAGMKTTAKLSEDGTHYVLNGAKTFITGGVHADRVIVCARTSAPTAEDRRHGISLFAVDTKSEGYSIGRKLDKLGLRTSDTAELAFVDVKVPVEDLLHHGVEVDRLVSEQQALRDGLDRGVHQRRDVEPIDQLGCAEPVREEMDGSQIEHEQQDVGGVDLPHAA